MDIGSDHRIARARVAINNKLIILKKIQKQKPLRLDFRVLEKLATPLRIELKKKIKKKKRFDTQKDEEPSIEKINKILRKSMDTIQSKTQKSTIKKSIDDTEIESVDKKTEKK